MYKEDKQMPYTPSNPYIPGDPYSYDLKWIVEKIKEAITLYEPLNTKFNDLKAYVMNYFNNLDLSSEVRAVIGDMQASGYFDDLLYEIAITDGNLQSIVTDWLNDNVTPVGSAVLVDDSLTIAGAAADAQTVGNIKDAVYNIIDDASIENYVKVFAELSGTLTSNTAVNNAGIVTPLTGWSYTKFSVNPNTDYLISGTGSTAIRLFNVYDAADNLIDIWQAESTVYLSDVAYTTPADAASIIVNTRDIYGLSKIKNAHTLEFIEGSSTKIGTETTPGNYDIITGDFGQNIQLAGSYNGAFNFQYIAYQNVLFKAAIDDITPVNYYGAGYIGANHGYNFVYAVTSNNHGLSENNIGETVTIDGNEWVLIRVIDTNAFQVVCRDTTWYGVKRVTPFPTSFTFNSGTQNVDNSALTQYWPSVKNTSVRVIKNDAHNFIVAEKYDIIDFSTGLAWIIANAGSATNSSILDHADLVTGIQNIYNYNDLGVCTISQSLKMYKSVQLGGYGGAQSIAFSASDKFAVPETSYSTLSQATSTIYFDDTTWTGSDAPVVFVQQDGADSSHFMILIILNPDRDNLLTNSAGFINYPSLKMYPYVLQPSAPYPANTFINNISVRMPAIMSNNSIVSEFEIGDARYVFIYSIGSGYASIDAPDRIKGHSFQLVKGDLDLLNQEVIADTLEIQGAGYAILKLI